jgi:hypothetical protein
MSEIIYLELKYCERCGGLLLRRAGLSINFCKPCLRIERDLLPLPALRPRARRAQPAVILPFRPASVRSVGRIPDIHGCCEGEQA